MDQSGFISAGEQQLHYLKWGSGKKLLLAFHGYADNAEMFSLLAGTLGAAYTILAIDLPYHGKSDWKDHIRLSKPDLADMIRGLCDEYSVNAVTLIGYSMGGRVCLTIIEEVPQQIEQVILVATDGLTTNNYYYFFTQTGIGKRLFRHMLLKPALYLRMMALLNKWKIVNASRYKFAMHFLQSAENRDFLLRVWPSMSELMPATQKVKLLIKQHNIPVHIFMGRYDKVLPPSLAKKFSAGLPTIEVVIIDKGHKAFDKETVRQITQKLLA